MSKTSKTAIPLPSPLIDTLDHLIENNGTLNVPISKKHQSDLNISIQFLLEYKGSVDTFNSYRREVERLLQWCIYVRKAPFGQLKREDILSFLEFCEHPPSHWIGLKNAVPRFLDGEGIRKVNLEWRPFVSKIAKNIDKEPKTSQFVLSNNAMKAIFRILSSFFRYLFEEAYINANPVAKIRQKSRFIKKTVEARLNRTLTETQWRYVVESTKLLAEKKPIQHERSLFIMSSLYAMYLRISELVDTPRWTPQMNHFYKDASANWWFKTVGKGNKEREIAVSNDMLKCLKRYRQSMNLTPLPTPQENSPLIPKVRGIGGISSTRHIRRIVQMCFDFATIQLRQDGHQEEADFLTAATVHWMRHTGISRDVQERQREHVRDDAGHSTSAITDLYIDIDKQDRHKSSRLKKITP